MNFIKKMKISYKLGLILVVFMIGFLLFFFNSFNMLKQVKVNGYIYNEIVQGKDTSLQIFCRLQSILSNLI